ncbi:FAD binding domain protein [Metarhizium album ARSEF 1941]|uniref:FAD binding domain protein n=1 Tax=Metarhizium album (strain ARSEF 1941) TaxID=1081103 RepID=A0A0B2WJP1_METAS|nr:FAD binding domain protein [Metarhizium album ARSEF 1941]KHN93702.1 FAD binding domain protein [Metarhizium album ARSEF 1941]
MGFRVTRLMVTLRFEEPEQPHGAHEQPENTFRTLFSGLSLDSSLSYTVPFADLTTLSDSFFPAGYRRGFWGPQVINVTETYLSAVDDSFREVINVTETYLSAVDDSFRDYIDAMLTRGETPSTSTWVLQYMLPGLNGHLPASDADTAWPHSVAGHWLAQSLIG